MSRMLVISVPGLTQKNSQSLSALQALKKQGFESRLSPVGPGLTLTSQSNVLTGVSPEHHGVVGNGWYWRDLNEAWLWRQSEALVEAELLWDNAKRKDPKLTCLKHFWWFGLKSSSDWNLAPRPVYHADGRKSPGVVSYPDDLSAELQSKFGTFPLFQFWGPGTSIKSSQWIADTNLYLDQKLRPALNLLYLPHLDYNQQRFGPDHPSVEQDLKELNGVLEKIVDYAQAEKLKVMVISEYGILPVSKAVALNQVLRQEGWLKVISNQAGELLDYGRSQAFALCDHQFAHVYLNQSADQEKIKASLQSLSGVAQVLSGDERNQWHLNHPRSGDLVCVAEDDAWFAYPWWLDEDQAPDFARTVDIHKKPGFDPLEMFLDPVQPLVKLKCAWKLLQKKMGFRTVMDVIPLDTSLVGGSHGVWSADKGCWPICCANFSADCAEELPMTSLRDLILKEGLS